MKMLGNLSWIFITWSSLLWREGHGQSSNYCAITPQHSLCQTTSPSSNCGRVYNRGLTQTEKQEALDEHNRLRSLVATGGTNQPPAADMMELQWDEELARVAQARADTCQFGHECRDCRRVARFAVGQNIFRARDNRVEVPEWRHVIRSFFSEISLFPGSGSIARFKYTPGTGHYTQMVWSRVTRVGCGLITYYNDETAPLIARYYVCDYGPSGNKVGDKMYAPGPSCSACPSGTSCRASYPGLCSGPGYNYDSDVTFIDNNFIDDNQFSSRLGIQSASAPISPVQGNERQIVQSFQRQSPPLNQNNYLAETFRSNRGNSARRRISVRPRRIIGRQPSPCNIWCSLGRLFGL